MAATRYELLEPDFFNFTDLRGKLCRGADQEWYRDEWQRKAGCGPTTAATCLSYLAHRNPDLLFLRHEGRRHADDFVSYMEAVWEDVTPTNRGLHSLELYWSGSQAFALRKGGSLSFDELAIGGKCDRQRPSLAACTDFIKEALLRDLPIAFLNFSNGSLKNLDSWHWVPLIAAEEREDGAFLCSILDEGLEKSIDFTLWHQTTNLGGGLVTMKPTP